MPDWRVELLRLSFFGLIPSGEQPKELWPSMFETQADSRIERTKEGLLVEQGVWNTHTFQISQQRDRVDVVLQARVSGPSIPDAGNFFELVDDFSKIIKADLGRPISRVAFGAVLHLEVANQPDAMSQLANFLPSVKITKGSRDFFYQINRPVPSGLSPDVEINRLSKWASIVARFLSVQGGANDVSEVYAVQLEIDVSTGAEKILPTSVNICDALIPELISSGKLLAEHGDLYES